MNLFLSLGKRKEALVMIIYHHLSFFYGKHAKIRRDNRPLPSKLNRICPTGLTSPHRSHVMVFGCG